MWSRASLLLCLVAVLSLAIAAALLNRWTVGTVVLSPGPAGTFDSIAVKDPSIVRYQGRWHVFYTARNQSSYTLGYVAADRLENLRTARHQLLTQQHARHSKYAAAPQVFFFRPAGKWYLIYQTNDSNYLPVYSTTTRLNDPASWTSPQPLIVKTDATKWIDFWVICDASNAYLFFTRNQREVAVMTTPLDEFPNGFSKLQIVYSPVHEGVHVYSVKGSRTAYVMLYEQQSEGIRRFGLARSSALGGPWKMSDDNFATGYQLFYAPGQPRWTEEVSHGELLRVGFDERLEVPAGQWRFLIQGLLHQEHTGDYPLLPWKLGLITAPSRQ